MPWPVIAYLVTIYFPLSFTLGPLTLSTTRLLLMVLIIPLTVRLVRRDFGPITLPDVLFFFFVAWLLIAMRVSDPSRAIAHFGSVGVEFLGGYMITRAYVRTPADFRNFIWALVVFIIATLPLGLIEMATGHPIMVEIMNKIPGARQAFVNPPYRRLGLDRVSTVFEHAILYGLFCATVFSMVLVGLKGAIRNVRRWQLAAVVAFCSFTSLSSAATIALVMQLALIGWGWMLRWFPLRWMTLMVVFAVGYSSTILIFNRDPFELLADNFTYNPQTAYHRTWILEWGLKSVWNHPLTGIGLNDWERPWNLYSASVDNFWLLVAMRYGIPAFVAVMLGFVLTIALVALRNDRGDQAFANARAGWVISMVCLSFVLATVFIWGSAFSLVLSLFGAGVWMLNYTPVPPEASRPVQAYTRFPQRRPPVSQPVSQQVSRQG